MYFAGDVQAKKNSRHWKNKNKQTCEGLFANGKNKEKSAQWYNLNQLSETELSCILELDVMSVN